MNAKTNYSLHIAFSVAIFTLANAIITLPFSSADDKTFLGFIIAFFISLGINILLVVFLSEKDFSCSLFFKFLYCVLLLLVLFEVLRSFALFVKFASEIILPSVSAVIIGAVFLLCIIYTFLKHNSVILKFSLFSFLIVAILIIIFFILSSKEYRADNIFLLSFPDISEVAKQSYYCFIGIFLPVPIVFLWQKGELGSVNKRASIIGFCLGGIFLALTFLNTLLLFGAEVSARIEFPYASAISTVTVGYLFSRMDGFSYFIYFACVLVKIIVLLGTIKTLIKHIKS